MPVSSHPNLTKPHYTSNWSNTYFKEQKYNKHHSSLSVVQQRINAINNNIADSSRNTNNNNMSNQYTMQDESPTGGYGPPAISHAPSGGSSLAYSMDTDAMEQLSSNASSPKQQHSNPQLLPPSNNPSTSVGGGEMSAEQYEEYYNNPLINFDYKV